MRLTLRLFGHEVLHAEVDQAAADKPERPHIEASGGGQFELDPFGFVGIEQARSGRASTVPRR